MSQKRALQFSSKYFQSSHFLFIVGWSLLAIIVGLMGISQIGSTFDQDELEAIHTGWKMIHDGVIYRDFFQHHHPLLYYLLKQVIVLCGEQFTTLIIIKLITFCIYLSIAGVVYLLGVSTVGHISSLTALYLLLPAPIFTKLLQTRPDGLQVLFSMVALLFLLYCIDEKKVYKRFFFLTGSALALSISFFALQKALFLMIGIAFLMTGLACAGRIKWSEWAWYGIVGVLPFIGYLFYLSTLNSLYSYYQLNWLFNIGLPTRFLPFYTFLILGQSQVLSIFYALAICCYVKEFKQYILAGLSLWLLFAAIFLVKCSYAQYYAPAIPLMALIAAHALITMLEYTQVKIIIVFFSLAFHPVCSWGYSAAKTLFKNEKNMQHEQIKYVMNLIPPGKRVYDGENNFNVFRSDIDYLWFVACDKRVVDAITTFYSNLTGRFFDRYVAIKEYKPAVISSSFLEMDNEYLKTKYEKSMVFDDLYFLTEL